MDHKELLAALADRAASGVDLDTYNAHFLAALDETKDIAKSLEIADKAMPNRLSESIGLPSMMPSRKVKLWRAAHDDIITDTASFSTSREAAKHYLDNPGFGGPNLYRSHVDIPEHKLIDLHDMNHDEAVAHIRKHTNLPHPAAIGVDEWVPRIANHLVKAGFDWARVKESHPVDSETYIYLGGGDEPELRHVKK